MTDIPEPYAAGRAALGFDEVPYGVGGVELYPARELESAQVGYSVDPSGRSLVGVGPGDWHQDWVVIGHETACGDPIFLSSEYPYPVFTAIHGQGEWTPDPVAPSLECFWRCLKIFKEFALHRGSPVEAETNAPGADEIDNYLQQVLNGCDGNTAALFAWALWANIDLSERIAMTGEP